MSSKKTNYLLTLSYNADRLVLAIGSAVAGWMIANSFEVVLPLWVRVLFTAVFVIFIDGGLDAILNQLQAMDGKKDENNALDADNAPWLWYGVGLFFLVLTGGTNFFAAEVVGGGVADYVHNEEEAKQKEKAYEGKQKDIYQLRALISEDSTLLAGKIEAWQVAREAAITSTRSTWNIKTFRSGAYGNYSREKSPAFFRYVDNVLRIDTMHRELYSPIQTRIAENKNRLASMISKDTDSEVKESVFAHNAREQEKAKNVSNFIWVLEIICVIALIPLFFLIKDVRKREGADFDFAAHSIVQWLMDRSAETNNVLLSALGELINSLAAFIAAFIIRFSHILLNGRDMVLGSKSEGLNNLSFHASASSQPQVAQQSGAQTTQEESTQSETTVRTTLQEHTGSSEQEAPERPTQQQSDDLSAIVKGFSDLQAFLAAQNKPTQSETPVSTGHTDFSDDENTYQNTFIHKGERGIKELNKSTVKGRFNQFFERSVDTAKKIIKAIDAQKTDEVKGKQKEAAQLSILNRRLNGGNGVRYWREAHKSVWGVDLLPDALAEQPPAIQEIIKTYIIK